MILVGRRSGQHIDHRGVTKALGDGESNLRIVGGGAVFIDLVLGGSEIAGIGIERVEKAVESAGGDSGNVGWSDVVVLNFAQNLGVDAHLLVGGILFVAGMDADPAELAQDITDAQAGKDHKGDCKDKTLEKSGHSHHQSSIKRCQLRTLYRRNDTPSSSHKTLLALGSN